MRSALRSLPPLLAVGLLALPGGGSAMDGGVLPSAEQKAPRPSQSLEIEEPEEESTESPADAPSGEASGRDSLNNGSDTGPDLDLGTVSGPELFLRANQAYEDGEYGRAIAFYRELLDRGHRNGHLHYNLGNAYLRDGQLGRAVAAYRRSLARLPRNQDVHANLDFARRSVRDALTPPSPSPLISTLFFWHFQMSRRELAWAVVVLNALFWSLLALWLVRRGSEVLPWLIGGVLLFLLGSGGSLLVHELWPQRIAVVLPPEIDARSGPGTDAVVRFKLHAGTELAVEDLSEQGVRIALPDGQRAWVERDQVEIVRW